MTEVRIFRVCIIDDEPIACRRIERLLKEDPEIEIIQVCHNGDDASQAIEQRRPDLIFLDVQMPEMDGFEILESVKHIDRLPHVIFVTAYDRYAIRAFEVHALDYLLKPFDRKRFVRALIRGKAQISGDRDRSQNRDVCALLDQIQKQPRTLERLVIKNRGKIFFLKTEEIDWIEAHGKYASIYTGQDSHLVREGMNHLETELDPSKFVRIHKSTIVNIDRIEHLQPLFHGDYRAILRDGTILTVSRRYRPNLDELIGQRL